MEEGCCPRFDPEPWDGKSFEWKDKRFIRGSVFTLFYMPVNFGGVITKLMKKAESAGAKIPGWVCLSDHTSPWNMDIYLAVDREVPGADNRTMGGKFFSKVYEGQFSDTGKWCKDFTAQAKREGVSPGKMYMWYTTCPKCAKKYGKNYVVVMAEAR
ncbi:MAG: hydrolase [Candidatus Bilamarchaeaceae archaeon]